jgi:nitrogen regulatory protein PII-like uncharacterized protein
MKLYPTKFECIDETGAPVFTVEMFDEAAATVAIKTLVNEHSWREVAEKVAEALKRMELE